MMFLSQIHPLSFLLLALLVLTILYSIVKAIIRLIVKLILPTIILFIIYLFLFDSEQTDKSVPPPNSHQVVSTSIPQNPSPQSAKYTKAIQPTQDNNDTPPAPTGNVYIKLRDTYSIKYNANNRKKQINYPAFVKKHIVKNVTTFFIIVGPFSSKDEAKKYLREVQESQFPFKGKIFTMGENKSQMT